MKKTAQLFSAWMAVFLFFTVYGFAQAPMPISPESDEGAALLQTMYRYGLTFERKCELWHESGPCFGFVRFSKSTLLRLAQQ